ncbi:hypothetical protein I302_107045 [Kwoniella bestiolae CBS 10118]|uniref:Uncharacterized protein n=1 Tax=Kwoniella bestiolae CBS 10118 TaxID=1296100 RepID=A0A1B9FZP2_9TREE|nr:hypothetical protein I302_05690 [Kwoniella bestiolae CBS 10118]OCF24231.1 hypothetical protein I302_05690 [Kwoniella bestiolae CBS 10118]
MDVRAEPHLSHSQTAGNQDEDWFQSHSTQVFLIFGSILFVITLICLYCLTRKQGQWVLPSCLRRTKHKKSRMGNRPVSHASSVNGLLSSSLNRRRSGDPTIIGGMDLADTHGEEMDRMRMWQHAHSGPGGGNKQLWRKTAYLTDLKRATEKYSNYYRQAHGKQDFPDGFERVTRDTFYGSIPPNGGGSGGHRRNTNISSFGHPPSSSFYENGVSPSPYSVYDGSARPISNYIPYNPLSQESLAYPPSVQGPITNYRRSFVSHMTDDPRYLEDLKSRSRKSSARASYYPKSPASTYVPPRGSVHSYRSDHDERDQDNQYGQYGHEQGYDHDPSYDYQYDRAQGPQYPNQSQDQYQSPIPTPAPAYQTQAREQGHYNNQIQAYGSTSPPQLYVDTPHQAQQTHESPSNPNPNSYLTPSPIEYHPNPKPSLDQSIQNDYKAYTQPQPYPTDGSSSPPPRPGHGRTPSMGSIKFPEPEPRPSPSPSVIAPAAPPDKIISPCTRSSTYSFPAPPTGEGQFDLRLSTQPPPRALESARTFDTYGYPAQGYAEAETEEDPYSPSRTEVNTKLNSASYYSPSLISKQTRMSTSLGASRLSSSIAKGFDASDGVGAGVGGTGRQEKRNSGPSLGKSDNPNPSPNFPPPPGPEYRYDPFYSSISSRFGRSEIFHFDFD